MEDLFVPYKEALILKELGFDEPCFAFFNENKNLMGVNPLSFHSKNSDVSWNCKLANIFNKSNKSKLCTAPLYDQAFEWFSKKYGLHKHIIPEFYIGAINFNYIIEWYLPKEKYTKEYITDSTGMYGDNGEYPTERMAYLACLKHMIEIIKEK